MTPRIFLFVLSTLLLAACASGPDGARRSSAIDNAGTQIDKLQSGEYYIEQAEIKFKRSGNTTERNAYLLQAVQAFQQNGQCLSSLRMLQVLQSELNTVAQQNEGRLLSAECLLLLPQPQIKAAHDALTSIQGVSFNPRVQKVKISLAMAQQEWLTAAKLSLEQASTTEQDAEFIWHCLDKLSRDELLIASDGVGQLEAWLQLNLLVRDYALQPSQLALTVSAWQQKYTSHPLAAALPKNVQILLEQKPLSTQNIAVLLPLTGRLSAQGHALKNGIIAAYMSELAKLSDPQQSGALNFYDSASSTSSELLAQIAEADMVIGPLLKENVVELLELLPPEKAILALNRIDHDTMGLPRPDSYYFSLAPEDEAAQLAQYIRKQGRKRPIIFSADNSISQRMTEAFVSEWQKKLGEEHYIAPDIASFNGNKDMRRQVTEMLDVAQSKQRIRQIENLAIDDLYGVERNRLDIDAIVLFADVEQTGLLNPMIESSLSPFARQALAVFASSRSYSNQLSGNTIRDLRNLTFSDMPWMLPNATWQVLSAQSEKLWPQKEDNLLRLFAMGYDAYNMLPSLRYMQLANQSELAGLTGSLKMTKQGVIERRLSLARVMQDRVSLLEAD